MALLDSRLGEAGLALCSFRAGRARRSLQRRRAFRFFRRAEAKVQRI